jgi:glycosyltransferase involved in cell wall biosynthesis
MNSSKQQIVYVGPFKFPAAGAESYRVLGIAQSLRDGGHDVYFCTGQLSQFENVNNTNFPLHYINLSMKPLTFFSKVYKYLFSGFNTIKWLESFKPRPDVVILYGGYSLYAFPLLKWCRQNNIPIIVDVADWLEPEHLPGGKWGPFRWNVEMALRYYFVQAKNIISISSYLESYYQKKGCRTLRIPPTLDVISIPVRIETMPTGPLSLAYTGVPGKKDLLNNVLEAILRLDLSGKTVLLTIAGPTSDEIVQFPALSSRGMTKLPDSIQVLGKVSRDEALDIVRQADFSVLLRPQLRYANAGFPTKVSESLSVGTPVICNLTSDLDLYIHDEVNGLICKDHTVESFSKALAKALTLTQSQLNAMREAARREAETSFDFRQYTYLLSNFLNEVH